ncbi:sarcosine oxidase subunit delta [Limobrevibacterium gyesilva]|uniref:Sarcosine oxidase subunit delta n=1 Tax=Limobrevibacterium gyesilva TaxID=2991712 RepID=A0AA42CD35_9PROT|nr:sarcosine oxidase subunit delta [Limobrevibacterium gyesilva]MCW3474378.1 sarcosine oxidase subunit delta [Limobrevibacterium gyesilva]
MLLIPCPWCGPRSEPEFQFGGEPATRPVPAAEVSDAAWGAYLYVRSNEKGPHRELWCHAGGCGQWFLMERDTVTHAVLRTHKPGAAA